MRLERCRNFEESTSTTSSSAWSISFCSAWIEQRIALHEAERPEPLRAHEHAPRVEIARHVVLEGRQDDVLLAIDRAAGQHHRVLGVLEQVLGDRERIGEDRHAAAGQEMHHLEGGGAAVDDDRLAVLAEFDRLAGDGALLRGVEASR